MEDDIDDLLDECETKFCHSASKPKQKPPSKNNSGTTRNEDRKSKRLNGSMRELSLLL